MKRFQVRTAQVGYVVFDCDTCESIAFGQDFNGALEYARAKNNEQRA